MVRQPLITLRVGYWWPSRYVTLEFPQRVLVTDKLPAKPAPSPLCTLLMFNPQGHGLPKVQARHKLHLSTHAIVVPLSQLST